MKRAGLCMLLVLWPSLASSSALMIDASGLQPTEKDFPTCVVSAAVPFQRKVLDLGLIDIVQVQPHAYCVVLRDADGPIQTVTLPNHEYTGGHLGDVIQNDGYVSFALYFSAGLFEHVAVRMHEGKLIELPMPLLQGLGHLLINALISRPAAGPGEPGR